MALRRFAKKSLVRSFSSNASSGVGEYAKNIGGLGIDQATLQKTTTFESAAPPQTSNVYKRVFGENGNPQFASHSPLPLSDVVIPSHTTPVSFEDPKISTLSNGLAVISQDRKGAVSNVSLFAKAGSRYEEPHELGMASALETALTKSTVTRSHFRLTRELQKLGGELSASASRDSLGLHIDVLAPFVDHAVATLSDQVYNSTFYPHDMTDAADEYAHRYGGDNGGIGQLALEAAFGDHPIANPFNVSGKEFAVENFDHLARAYVEKYFVPERMVLTGLNVEHDRLVDLASEFFGERPRSAKEFVQVEKPKFLGAELRDSDRSDDFVQLCLAFPTVDWNSKDVYAVAVIQSILGGGASFSEGGPGKGLRTRLYQLLAQKPWISETAAHMDIFDDAGLLTVSATASPQYSKEIGPALYNTFKGLSQISQEDVDRAKNSLVGQLGDVENSCFVAEDLAKHYLTHQALQTPSEGIAAVKAVTKADVERVASDLLQVKPAVAVVGNAIAVPAASSWL